MQYVSGKGCDPIPYALDTDWPVVEAVRCEPVSALISLLYGNLQGIFAICREFGHLSLSGMPLDRRSTTEIPYAKNKEFSVGNLGSWLGEQRNSAPTRLAFDV